MGMYGSKLGGSRKKVLPNDLIFPRMVGIKGGCCCCWGCRRFGIEFFALVGVLGGLTALSTEFRFRRNMWIPGAPEKDMRRVGYCGWYVSFGKPGRATGLEKGTRIKFLIPRGRCFL